MIIMTKKKNVFNMSERLSREYYGKKNMDGAWNVHVRSKKQCPVANFGLHFNSKQ